MKQAANTARALSYVSHENARLYFSDFIFFKNQSFYSISFNPSRIA